MPRRGGPDVARGVPWRRITLWLAATFLLWAVASGLLLLRAQGRATAAEASVKTLAGVDGLDGLDLDAMHVDLSAASTDVGAARADLEHPILVPWRMVPYVGRQLDAARSLVVAADDLVVDALVVVRAAQTAKATGGGGGGESRVEALSAIAVGFADLAETIETVDLGPDGGLASPLQRARDDVASELAALSPRVDQYEAVSRGLAAFLSDGTYLLLGANNAEMRIASGMHLSVGEITLSDGRFQVPGLTPADDLDPIAGADFVDEFVEERWGFLDPDDDFRKVAYTARFDESVGPQAVSLWRAATGSEVDGVIALDPYVLQGLLEVVGSVEVEGVTYDADSVLVYLLQGQYEAFDLGDEAEPAGLPAGQTLDESDESQELRDERRDQLSALATAVANELGTAEWDPLDLVRALRPAAEGRHILVYSVDPAEQAGWAALGVDGRLEGVETGFSWLNTGASKLDPFLDVSVDVTESLDIDVRTVTYLVTTTNRATAALPDYALGPWETLDLPEAGSYRGRLAFYAPNGVVGAELDPALDVDVFGPDGELLLVASAPVTVLPGETVSYRFTYRLPASHEIVEILPSARFPATGWSWGDRTFDDSAARTIRLGG